MPNVFNFSYTLQIHVNRKFIVTIRFMQYFVLTAAITIHIHKCIISINFSIAAEYISGLGCMVGAQVLDWQLIQASRNNDRDGWSEIDCAVRRHHCGDSSKFDFIQNKFLFEKLKCTQFLHKIIWHQQLFEQKRFHSQESHFQKHANLS